MDFQGVEKNEEEAKNTWLEKKEENDKNQTHAIKHQKRPAAHQNGDRNQKEQEKKKEKNNHKNKPYEMKTLLISIWPNENTQINKGEIRREKKKTNTR
jgi:hypothetical protein